MLERIPIRLRLTLAFAGVMAIVLAGGALFMRASLTSDLDNSIQQALRTRAADVQAIADDSDALLPGGGQSPLTEGGATIAQILDSRGGIVDATPRLRTTPLLTPAQAQRALRAPLTLTVDAIPGVDSRVRLLAVRARGAPERIVVVGTSLGSRDEAVSELTVLLAIGAPLALLLASAAAYALASAALRPVEAMRARAARISGAEHGERLPLPAADDEIRRLGETLNALLARTDAALSHERAFVADASHELRTPLAILKTELELALRGPHTALQLEQAIASAQEETDRLVRLAEDLLVIARSDQGGLPVRFEPLTAGELLADVAGRHAAQAQREARSLATAGGDSDVIVAGDRMRLEQALSNLVENALRHGGGDVRLEARRAGDMVELHVRDEGPGVEPGFRDAAFDRFARADAARTSGGSGLGLSIVRAIARAHGGEAHIANVPGGGLDAWISLPAEPAPDRRSPVGGPAAS